MGEHNEEVLGRLLDYSEGEIADLYAKDVIGNWDHYYKVPGLDEQGYTLLWVATGEKVVITGNIPRRDDRLGRLNILGVFRIQRSEIRGGLFTRLSE